MSDMSSMAAPTGGIKAKLTGKNIGIALLIILVLIVSWYFMYWKKTPEYSLGIIRDSIQKHDVITFEKHVDMDSLFSHAFDDIILASLNDDKDMNDFSKTLAMGFAQVIKQPFIMTMKEAGKQYVEKGSVEDASKKGKTNDPKVSPKEMSQKTGITASEFKGIAYTKKEGKIATIGIKIYEKQVEKDMVIDLKMNELGDGTWRLSEISNLKDYMSKLETYRTEKLTALNQPIKEQIDGLITPGKASARVASGDRWGFSQKLYVTIPCTFPSGQIPIAMHGKLIVENASGKSLMSAGIRAENFKVANNASTLYYSFELNPFIEEQKAIMSMPQNALNLKISIDQIKLPDGNEVKLLDKLPEA